MTKGRDQSKVGMEAKPSIIVMMTGTKGIRGKVFGCYELLDT